MDSIKVDLHGQLNSLKDFKNEALLPVFEAVINSIQSIEEAGGVHDGIITVKIIRDEQQDIEAHGLEEKKILSFEIQDNGIGFTDTNLESFQTLYTRHKLSKGCKGVGRFFWLKAFDIIEIDSTYKEYEEIWNRAISFSVAGGINASEKKKAQGEIRTVVRLIGFKDEYRKQPSAFKKPATIAQRILEHTLSFFINDAAPKIIIEDDEDICLHDIYNRISKQSTVEEIKLKGYEFRLFHMKLFGTTNKLHNIVLCGNSRDIMSFGIEKMLGTNAQFEEENERFVYSVYVTGEYIDKHSDHNRMEFNIPKEECDVLVGQEFPISLEYLKREIVNRSQGFLKNYLDVYKAQKEKILADYVATKNPTLRAVIHYCPEVFDEIELNASEEKIDEILHKYKGKAEFKIKTKSKDLLKTQVESYDSIKEEYEKITLQIEDFQKDQLAGYIIFRKLIIDLLEKKIAFSNDDAYYNEKIIHDIVFPRKSTTDEIDFSNHNLWLIDESLTFHQFAVSDKPIKEYIDNAGDERPDVVIFSETDDSSIARVVSLIEFKKPMRQGMDEDPTVQLFRYIRRIKDGKILLPNGRKLHTDSTSKFFGYAICDFNEKLKLFAEDHNYSILNDNYGYYFYNPTLNAHIELIDYNKIVSDTKRRHKIFFRKLSIE